MQMHSNVLCIFKKQYLNHLNNNSLKYHFSFLHLSECLYKVVWSIFVKHFSAQSRKVSHSCLWAIVEQNEK